MVRIRFKLVCRVSTFHKENWALNGLGSRILYNVGRWVGIVQYINIEHMQDIINIFMYS